MHVQGSTGTPPGPSGRVARLRGHGHRLGPSSLLAVGAATVTISHQMSLGRLTSPGPGLWPFLSGMVLVGCALFLLIRDSAADYETWTARSVRIGAVLGCLAMFVVAFQYVGLVLPGAALLVVWLRVFAREPWRLVLPLAVGIPVVLFVLFGVALEVPFPPDLVGEPLEELLT